MNLSLGDTVRLTSAARNKWRITLDMQDHEDARVIGWLPLIGDDYLLLSRHMAGKDYWSAKDLVRVKKGHHVEPESIPLKFSAALPPRQRHTLVLGETWNNLDFGFSPAQAAVLDSFEAAVKELYWPCIGHGRRSQRRKCVLATYQAVVAAGLQKSLTPHELEAVGASFDNPVLPS